MFSSWTKFHAHVTILNILIAKVTCKAHSILNHTLTDDDLSVTSSLHINCGKAIVMYDGAVIIVPNSCQISPAVDLKINAVLIKIHKFQTNILRYFSVEICMHTTKGCLKQVVSSATSIVRIVQFSL